MDPISTKGNENILYQVLETQTLIGSYLVLMFLPIDQLDRMVSGF